jgi:hypothetical protein
LAAKPLPPSREAAYRERANGASTRIRGARGAFHDPCPPHRATWRDALSAKACRKAFWHSADLHVHARAGFAIL